MPFLYFTLSMSIPIQHAFVFRFLSLAFAYPNEAFLSELKSIADKINDKTGSFIRLIASFEKEKQEMLQAEYTRLFINGYSHTPCPPYESVYREKRMLGQASIDVQALYREWEMSVETGLIDHIATEFEFLSFLASASTVKTIATAAKDSSDHFIKEHLCRWVPQFVGDLKSATSLDAYRLLGILVECSLKACR